MKITKQYIEAVVKEYYGMDNINPITRDQAKIEPRKFVWLFCKELTQLTDDQIGDGYNGGGRVNVYITSNKLKGYVETDKDMKKKYNDLLELITKTNEQRLKDLFVSVYGYDVYKVFINDKKYN